MRLSLRLLPLIAALTCAGAAATADRPAVSPSNPPNIILILTDDLGYGDLSSFGQKRFTTPGLDRLATEGARLTSHYCAAPVCAPSRASLLLGVHQGHANVRDNQFDKALEDNHTLATVLRRAGYATAAIGKWGLHGQSVGGPTGSDPHAPAHPLNRGFDSFYGLLRHIDGHEHYPKEALYFAAKAKARGPVTIWDNRTNVTPELDRCYTTDLFTARAKKFITDHAAATPRQPFFLYLSYGTPHAVLERPTQAYPAGGGSHGGLQWLGQSGHMINTASGTVDSWTDPRLPDDTAAQPWPDVYRRYATSVRRIDDSVADLLRLLADLHLDENTLVVFTSDNGPEKESLLGEPFTPEFFRSYGPFDGLKRDLWEGGTRVPTLARWPGRIPAGQVVAAPNAQWDWLPTFAAAAGLPPPARADGVSLLPVLTGRGVAPARDALYFEYHVAGQTPDYPDFEPLRRNRPRNQMQAVRLGDLVGVRYDVKSAADPFEIYDVAVDPKETKNLAQEPGYAAVQTRLQAAALRSRRPDAAAPRPYDAAPVPALDPGAEAPPPGLAWQAYVGDFPWVPDFATLTSVASGRSPRPDLQAPKIAGATGVLFTGCLQVPAEGEYTFYLTTDAGAELRLHEATVLDADFGYAGGTERRATIKLAAGLHPVRLSCLHGKSAPTRLTLEWSGPGLPRQPIPDSAWRGLN
jgi:arylsulfatase A-like enzyme